MMVMMVMTVMELLYVRDRDDRLVEGIAAKGLHWAWTRAEVRLRLNREFLLLWTRTRTADLHAFHRRLLVVLRRQSNQLFKCEVIYEKYS